MRIRKSGTLVLYVGGHWNVQYGLNCRSKRWIRGKKLCDDKYSCPAEREKIIERWAEMFALFEIAIIPDLPDFEDDI
jgi:hypothetical protein